MSEESGMMIINLLIQVFYALYLLLIVAVPVFLGAIFWWSWVKYVRTAFLLEQEHILLEFRLPKEITKSPIAMEVFLTSLHQTSGEGNFWDKYWKGGMRAWFSLELVSIEGQVHFFIWTRKSMRRAIETQLYSQYPDVEIAEVPDYTAGIEYDPSKNEMWGCRFVKVKDSHYPIKTYVDYGLDKDPKEELKIDPITPVLELLGSIGAHEQMWIQIIVRAHKKELKTSDKGLVDWTHFAKEEIKAKMERNKGDDGKSAERLTKGERGAIEAIEKTVSKFAFDTAIRAIYITDDKQAFNGANKGGLSGSVRQYNSNDLNGFKPTGATGFDYPWQDFRDWRLNRKKWELLERFKKRSAFKPAYDGEDVFIMNVEELATIYHFPGRVAKTPTFARIPSKKSEAPSNLPI